MGIRPYTPPVLGIGACMRRMVGTVVAVAALLALAPTAGAESQQQQTPSQPEPTTTTTTPPVQAPLSPTGEAIAGDLRYEAEDGDEVPAEGVELTIESADGAFTQTAETDAEGHFEVPVPGPGAYSVTIDDSSLPEDVVLRNADRTTLDVALRVGQVRNVLFPIDFGEAQTRDVSSTARPGGEADGPGHPLRPHHRHVRHRPVADLRHDRPDELLPRRAGHVRCVDRLPVQRDHRVAHVHRRPARHRGGRAVRSRPRPLASGGRCATGARA